MSRPQCAVAVTHIVNPPLRYRHRHWRWDTDRFRLDENPRYGGVFDQWIHLDSSFGYTHTRWGATLAAMRNILGREPMTGLEVDRSKRGGHNP